MSFLVQLTIFVFAIAVLVIFLRINILRGWIHSRPLIITVWLYISIIITLLLWVGSYDTWILRVGISFSLLVGFVIWFTPILAPDFAKQLGVEVDTTRKYNKKLLSALITFLYISIGYWFVMLMFDIKNFWYDFTQQLWIVPVALLFALIQFLRTK